MFPEHDWLDLEHLAMVEVTSEDVSHPIESAILKGSGTGWRSGASGTQAIRLLFDEPVRVRRVFLVFRETKSARTQEFVLRLSVDRGESYREVVRQQYTFSPPGTSEETENYRVEFDGLTELELQITPDISGGDARASLSKIRIA